MFYALQTDSGVTIGVVIHSPPEGSMPITIDEHADAQEALDAGQALSIEGGALMIPRRRYWAIECDGIVGFDHTYVQPYGSVPVSDSEHEEAIEAANFHGATLHIKEGRLFIAQAAEAAP